jgi:tetratricopeptide (TPR) repeat protein/lysophospholipase L1-like esterase
MAESTTQTKASGRAWMRAPAALPARLALLVGAPILFFFTLEAVLRISGFGRPADLFVKDGEAGVYRTNPGFTIPFMPASFEIQPLNFRIRKKKDSGSIRVFVLGESAAQGTPDPEFGFAAQLRAQLRALFPGRTVEVFNLGITAIDSHVIYRAVGQLSDFQPDLLVVYMGNNEVIGPYGPGCAYLSAMPPLWVIRSSVWVRSTRSGQLLGRIWAKLAPRAAGTLEWRGMETFADNAVSADDPRLEAVYRNFSANLNDILGIAGRAGIRTVLATVVANLKDNAPFISLHRPGMSDADLKAWKAAADAGRVASDLGDVASAKYEFEEALRMDPEFADTHFRLARIAESLGDGDEARRRYLDALHWDALRFRPDARLNEITRRAAHGAAGSVVLVDAAKEMGSDPASNAPPPGSDILFDHVHFNWEGNFRMAQMLADGCVRALSGRLAPDGAALDRDGCAAALGYTPAARLKMLEVVVRLTLRPPFTGQYTFSADQARLKRQVEAARTELGAPGEQASSIAFVNRALRLDPGNGPLAERVAMMEGDAGDFSSALALLDKAAALEPRSSDQALHRAAFLAQSRRFDEAEATLLGSLDLDREYFAAGNALVDLWTETRQFDKGKQFFAHELGRAPANPYLRLEYAELLARSGDLGDAEREERRVWDADPAGRPATASLEMLIRQYGREGRAADADALSLEARTRQPGDYFNNQRLFRIYTARNDPAEAAACLELVERSGPFDSAEHLDLAHRFADLKRRKEMLDELAQAGEVARIEGNEAQVHSVDELIGDFRRRFSEGQAR